MMKFLLPIFFVLLSFCVNGQNDLGIIGNETSLRSLNLREAKLVFKGKYNYWTNKKKVILVLPSSKNPNSGKTASVFYGTNPDGVKRFWLSLVFQGRASSPLFFDTDKEILEYIQKNEGAIGIVAIEQWKLAEEKYKISLTE